ncbi:MAG: Vitamin K epoxide reductase, partial [Candidatus Dormibacteraeota bacterium]|nr:Vitamin K epoxide reductase [Candidatus Dormibacteraeota bacterium]
PTSVAGIVWFAVAATLALSRLRRPQFAWSVIGLLTVVYLVFFEIVELGAICIWCTVAHAMVVVIFLLTVTVRAEEA